MKLSVFGVFAELFPEAVGEHGASAKNKRLRLHFNKVGYSIYGKEQSRRVPSLRAKPGNPGYGFRRARWRDTVDDATDGKHCSKILSDAGFDLEKVNKVKERIQEVRHLWDAIRRPSRPAGPGRPRRMEPMRMLGSSVPHDDLAVADPAEPRQTSPTLQEISSQTKSPQGVTACGAPGHTASGIETHPAMRSPCVQASPSLKRCREDDLTPSLYPRLTSLKLLSPAKSPFGTICDSFKHSPLGRDTPTCLRPSPNGETDNIEKESLKLPPLALPPMAKACSQPRGLLELERSLDNENHRCRLIIHDKSDAAELKKEFQVLTALEFLASTALECSTKEISR